MSLAITDASLLLGRELDYVERGYIEIENGRIKSAAAGSYKGAGKKLDAKGFLVIPGFINAHTHIADSIEKENSGKEQPRLPQGVHQKFCGVHDEKRHGGLFRFSRGRAGRSQAAQGSAC
jgi:cytosine/adenosine deaminase-related metal-dependent hydrolase